MTDKDVIISRLNGRIHWQRTTLLQKQVCIKKYKLKNRMLRELLGECKEFFEEENPKDFTVMSERMDELLTKIEKVMR